MAEYGGSAFSITDFDETSAPNGLGFSGGAPINRECGRDDTEFQNGRDLAREAVNCNHPSDTPYVGTAETALPIASSATIVPRQSQDPNTD
jgi:hypothetical protein